MMKLCCTGHPGIAYETSDWPAATACGVCPLCHLYDKLDRAQDARSALKRERAIAEAS